MEAAALRNVVPRERALLFFGYVAAVVLCAAASVTRSFDDVHATVRAASAGFWVIAGLAVLVDSRPFSTPGRGPAMAIFPSIGFSFAVLLGWGLAPAVTVQAAAVVVSAVRLRHAPWRAVFNASQYALSLAAAALVLRLAGVPALAPLGSVGVADVLAILAAAVSWFVVNGVLVAAALWLRFRGDWRAAVREPLGDEALNTLALLALGPLAVAAANVSAALVPLTLVPLYGVDRLARFSQEEQRKSQLDGLTGLPNRKALFAEMSIRTRCYQERSARGPGDQRRMALLQLDLDRFREINDALGHAVGDQVLVAVANRLRACIGADGFVARLGGDEFVILAPRLVDPSAAQVLAQRVSDALGEPVILDGLPLDVTAAIGVALYPDHGVDNTTLLRHAELAMYDAKNRGAAHAIYTPESDQHSLSRLALLADLRRSLESARVDEIQLHYQPQVQMSTGAVVGVEALLRWNHPTRGAVSPDEIIRVAEHTAVMRRLTRRVIEDVLGQLAKWRAHGLILRAAINVSVRDLHRPELCDLLAELLEELGVAANQVQLEITEGALMADPRRVMVTLHRLARLGVALSLDDFGTGYSSLQHLRRLPLTEVKIDRSFVLGMADDPDDAAVVHSIIDLARALGLRVVAEGVEDERTRRMLLASGCEVAQGWYHAKPMPADDLVTWLARHRPSGVPGQARGG